MDPARNAESLLGPYRVLDLTDEKGLLCGKLLGDLGADVIKVERVNGDSARNIGPFFHDIPDPEKSLYWWAFNLNKRGITLNLETEDGRALFRRLVQTADFVVESFAPGAMQRLGLGYEELSRINPRLIMTSITPFGQDGPYSAFKADDIVSMAMGGSMYVTGDSDRSPLRISFPISYSQAGAEAAAATMIAHYDREVTSEGQHVDVSIQECVVWTLSTSTTTWDLLRRDIKRSAPNEGRANPVTGLQTRSQWECADGYISFAIQGGSSRGTLMNELVRVMAEERAITEEMLNFDWTNLDMATLTQDVYDKFANEIDLFFKSKTTQDLFELSAKHRLHLGPIMSTPQIVASPHLKARDYFVQVDHPELEEAITYPNAFVKMSAWSPRISCRPPLIGEHNREIYVGELGLTNEQLTMLKHGGVI